MEETTVLSLRMFINNILIQCSACTLYIRAADESVKFGLSQAFVWPSALQTSRLGQLPATRRVCIIVDISSNFKLLCFLYVSRSGKYVPTIQKWFGLD